MKANQHKERKYFEKYNNEQYLLYLNETEVKFTETTGETPEGGIDTPVEIEGFEYSGDMQDGSTLIDATDVTKENRRDKFISGLIRKKYSADKIEAILLNGDDTEDHAAELSALQAYRRECKTVIDDLLSRK